jgi:hypothetical protein
MLFQPLVNWDEARLLRVATEKDRDAAISATYNEQRAPSENFVGFMAFSQW